MSDQVSRWLDIIQATKREMGLTQDSYPDDLVLALVEVESAGDPDAHRTNSQFHGLLQMGALAGQDAGFEQRGRDTTEALLGDGRLSIQKFLEYQERYKSRHCYQPTRCALLWKAGPGTLRTVNDLLAQGLSLNAAIEKGAANIPNTVEYIRRFRVARARWSAWIDAQKMMPI